MDPLRCWEGKRVEGRQWGKRAAVWRLEYGLERSRGEMKRAFCIG